MAEISYFDRQPFIDDYEQAARQLCLGGPGHHGSLQNVLGPLRSEQDRTTGLRYWLEHERDLDDQAFLEPGPDRSSRVSAWNLDFTLPVVVRVAGDPERKALSVESFIGEIAAMVGEAPSDDSILALSEGICAQYEGYWLDGQKLKLARAVLPFTGQSESQVDDQVFRSLAVDVTLREAHVASLRQSMWRHIAKAHKVATTFPGTTTELMRDRALRAITRPDHEPAYGQAALSPDEAVAMLRDAERIGAVGE